MFGDDIYVYNIILIRSLDSYHIALGFFFSLSQDNSLKWYDTTPPQARPRLLSAHNLLAIIIIYFLDAILRNDLDENLDDVVSIMQILF
jgi:hypothetical protein